MGDKKFSKINKFKNADGEEVIDLDHSVFMNFQYFSESNMDECFTNDQMICRVRKWFNDE